MLRGGSSPSTLQAIPACLRRLKEGVSMAWVALALPGREPLLSWNLITRPLAQPGRRGVDRRRAGLAWSTAYAEGLATQQGPLRSQICRAGRHCSFHRFICIRAATPTASAEACSSFTGLTQNQRPSAEALGCPLLTQGTNAQGDMAPRGAGLEPLPEEALEPSCVPPRIMTRARDTEIGLPANKTVNKVYRQTSVPMPTLEQVDLAVRTIRHEQKKVRRLTTVAGIFGICVIMILSAGESDSVAWSLAARSASAYLSPEQIRALIGWLVKWNMTPSDTRIDDPFLKTTIYGIPFPNPLGLSGGFDVTGENPGAYLKAGFGFVEIGTITPLPAGKWSSGENRSVPPKREPQLQAFYSGSKCEHNNAGLVTVAQHLAQFAKSRWTHDLSRFGILGVTIGYNAGSSAPLWDYAVAITTVGPYADFVVLDACQANTSAMKLVIRQAQIAMDAVMQDFSHQRSELYKRLRSSNSSEVPDTEADFNFALPNFTGKRPPLLLKVHARHVSDASMLEELGRLALDTGIDGLVVTGGCGNAATLIEPKPGTIGAYTSEAEQDTKDVTRACVFELYRLTQGKIPIIASGRVFTGEEALSHLEAGASAVQIDEALLQEGFGAARKIKSKLSALMYSKGYRSIRDAVGAAHRLRKVKRGALRARKKRLGSSTLTLTGSEGDAHPLCVNSNLGGEL